ncbi:MAG: alanine racemase [Acidimicrobiales bacterium]|nr:alanine racemase [Acidimicrobiales bacterium]
MTPPGRPTPDPTGAGVPVTGRPAWAEVDLAAVAHNVAVLIERVAPAQVCAVVKANGYGHGAVPVARAAVGAGASWLAVALVDEGVELRDAGLDAPVLVLSEPRPEEMPRVVAERLTPAVYTLEGVTALAEAARVAGVVVPVHLKVNTGMNRVGAQPGEVLTLARAIDTDPALRLDALWTHCAVADEPDHPFTAEQLARFRAAAAELEGEGLHPPLLHAANSAAALVHPEARFDLVRAGIAVYGIDPAPALTGVAALQPALSLHAHVTHVKRVGAGERVSYGLRHEFGRDATVATVPLGYADGVPRRLSGVGGEVLVGGRRRPIVGVVTMDQLMVDCGDDPVAVGDEVVLIGRQGAEAVTANEWGDRLGTIGYEVVCGIGPRVPRVYRGG